MTTYLVLGGHIGGPDGTPRFVTAVEVMRQANLDPADCTLANSAAQLRKSAFEGKTVVRPADAFKKGVFRRA